MQHFKTLIMSTEVSSEEFVVRVPGTTSNLGPGFDCLGMAVDLHNEVVVGEAEVSGPEHPMLDEALVSFGAAAGLEVGALKSIMWSIGGEVPMSRGLGSSVTLRLGLLAGLNEMHGSPLSEEQMFRACSDLEGHPDNAGPAVYGGFFVGGPDGSHFTIPVCEELRVVLLIPETEVLTEEARRVLPKEICFGEAVENVGWATALVAAFAAQDYEAAGRLMEDHLHQPYRAKVNPGMAAVLDAARSAKAYGAFLSGSGSTIAALAGDEEAGSMVGRAMQDALPAGASEVRVVAVDNHGLVVKRRRVGEE